MFRLDECANEGRRVKPSPCATAKAKATRGLRGQAKRDSMKVKVLHQMIYRMVVYGYQVLHGVVKVVGFYNEYRQGEYVYLILKNKYFAG